MKIKFSGVIDNLSLKANGEYRVQFRVPFMDMGHAISMVRLVGKEFKVGILTEEKSKAIIKAAYFYKLAIDREGESKVTISFAYEAIADSSLGFFGKHQNEVVNIVIKSEE